MPTKENRVNSFTERVNAFMRYLGLLNKPIILARKWIVFYERLDFEIAESTKQIRP